MSATARTRETWAAVERELAQERLAALRRIATRLEELLASLKALRSELRAQGPSAPGVEEYERLRREALQYRWFLEVQREALGLLHHEGLDAFYPIPEPVEG